MEAEHDPDLMQTSINYRALQVVGVLMNDILKTVIVTSLVVAATIMLAFGLTLLILLPATVQNVPVLGVCCLVVISVVAMLLVNIGLWANIYKQSMLNQHQLAVLAVTRRNVDSIYSATWKRKLFRSCASVRVIFGSINFIETGTPLKCFDFSNQLAVNLLLLIKKSM